MLNTETVRDKMARRGPEALTDNELAAFILSIPVEKVELMFAKSSPKTNALDEYARRRRAFDPRPIIDGPRAAAGQIPAEIRSARKEHFIVLVLNARRQLLARETVSIGTLSASLVHPREVFSPAIADGGAVIVAVHNHPSGDPSPSAEDREATRRLQRAGELLGIPLADHVIVSESSYFSFRESGLL